MSNIKLIPTKRILNSIASQQEQNIGVHVAPDEFFYLSRSADSESATTDINSFSPGVAWIDGIEMTRQRMIEIPITIIGPNITTPVAGQIGFTASAINTSNFAFLPFYNSLVCDRLELTIGTTTLVEDQADRDVLTQFYKYLQYDPKVLFSKNQAPLTDFINREQYYYSQPGGYIANAGNVDLPDYLKHSENVKSIFKRLNAPSRIKIVKTEFTTTSASNQYIPAVNNAANIKLEFKTLTTPLLIFN